MRSFILALLSTTALVAAVDVNTIVADFQSLNTNLQTLDTDVKKLQAGITGISQALQVSVDTVAVDNVILQTTSDVNAATKFSASDSQTIIDSINTVTQTANQTLTDTISQNATFAGLSPVVLASLYAIKIDQGNLGFALASKLDSSAFTQGIADLTALQNGIAMAIAAYGGSTS